MNRPFYAIGVLLAFLAVAMLAVGLSSRPTGRPASAQSGSGIQKSRRGPGSVVYLLVVPDEATDEATDESPAESIAAEDDAGENEEGPDAGDVDPAYAAGCGLDRNTGVVYPVQSQAERMTLRTTVVVAASEPIGPMDVTPMDCRSHCDMAYDAAVYGECDARSSGKFSFPNAADSLNSGEFSYPIESDDQSLTLFRSLLGDKFDARPGVSPRLKSAGRNWRFELYAWSTGLTNQAWRSAERLGLADEWLRWGRLSDLADANPAVAPSPAWSDYQEWIESPQAGVADRDTPAGGTASFLSQPWRQVLQFAVSWLNHAAKTLGAAAERLGGLQSEPSTGPVGFKSTGHQPR